MSYVFFPQLQCCGGASPADWQQSAWVQEDITEPNKLPESCCKQLENPKRRAPKNSVCGVPGEWVDGKHPGVWEKVSSWKETRFYRLQVCLLLFSGKITQKERNEINHFCSTGKYICDGLRDCAKVLDKVLSLTKACVIETVIQFIDEVNINHFSLFTLLSRRVVTNCKNGWKTIC